MLLFTYGMLTNQTVMHCNAVCMGLAVLPNWRWHMLQYANVYPADGDAAPGVLWRIDQAVLSECDALEGYPDFYNRHQVLVYQNGLLQPAWVYSMTHDCRESLQGTVPSTHYVNTVQSGFAQSNHQVDWL